MSFTKTFNSFPVIETDRLVLRKIETNDINDIFAYFSDDKVTRYLDFSSIKEVEMAERFVQRMSIGFENKEIIRWAITLKYENRLIGTCFLADFVEGSLGVLGYDLSRNYWNKGIMTEVLEIVIPFGFDVMGLHRIQAIVNPENIGSISLLKKMGFIKEGYLRKYEYHYDNEDFGDVIMFSLLKDEYKNSVSYR
jgi:ribosomal-protein-alanine N-acetyltransferase